MAFVSAIGSTQNSYSSIDDANTYHSERLHNSEWSDADNAVRESALVWASRTLDEKYDWQGSPTDTDNGLRWPRSYVYDRDETLLDSATIPAFLARATAELALELVKSDIFQNSDSFGIRKVSAGQNAAAVSFTGESATTIPRQVTQMISFYVTGSAIGSFTYLLKA